MCRTKATVTSIVLLIKYAHMLCYMSRSACHGVHACPCHHLFVGFPVDGHIYIYIYIIDVLKCISVYGGALLCLVVGICDLRRTNVHERFSVERLKPLGTRWRR